jgi:hypothetical protein
MAVIFLFVGLNQDPSFIGDTNFTATRYSNQSMLLDDRLNEARAELDLHYDRKSDGNQTLNGAELWRRFQLITEDLTTQLCEQVHVCSGINEPVFQKYHRNLHRKFAFYENGSFLNLQ